MLHFRVDYVHPRNLGRTQSPADHFQGVFDVLDNVDLLAADLADDRLHAHPLHADASAHRIDVAITRAYRDLGSLAGLACARHDLHGVVVDLRHLLFEQPLDQFFAGPRGNHRRAPAGLFDGLDHDPNSLARGKCLEP